MHAGFEGQRLVHERCAGTRTDEDDATTRRRDVKTLRVTSTDSCPLAAARFARRQELRERVTLPPATPAGRPARRQREEPLIVRRRTPDGRRVEALKFALAFSVTGCLRAPLCFFVVPPCLPVGPGTGSASCRRVVPPQAALRRRRRDERLSGVRRACADVVEMTDSHSLPAEAGSHAFSS